MEGTIAALDEATKSLIAGTTSLGDVAAKLADAAVRLTAAFPGPSGTTANRPKSPPIGTPYFDVTLYRPIWWTGAAWRDAAGKAV